MPSVRASVIVTLAAVAVVTVAVVTAAVSAYQYWLIEPSTTSAQPIRETVSEPALTSPNKTTGFTVANNPSSGYSYQSAAEQALQDDTFANPGYLWVDKGKALFGKSPRKSSLNALTESACVDCHAEKLTAARPQDSTQWQTAATRYPAFDSELQKVITLETRINECRTRYQNLPKLAWESQPLLALTAFVAHQSMGQTIAVKITPENTASLERGKNYYQLRKGQLNLACRHCHELNPGRMLRGDRLSQGLPTGYPAYKLEWQTLGSLQRRLRNCDIGVRAEPHEFGSQVYADLTLYLKLRAKGLAIDTPAVRR